MIRRVPVRWRLTAAFALAMAVVLAVVAVFLRLSLAHELDDAVDTSLSARSDELTAAVSAGRGGLAGPAERRLSDLEDGFAQVIGPGGAVLDASSPALRAPLLDADERLRAAAAPLTVDREVAPGAEGAVRLLARGADGARIVVVGASLDDRDEAVAGLTRLLLVAGPLALVAASALGYLLAAGALRPVELMRSRAGEISGARTGERLPLPEARDELRRLGETLNAMLARIDGALERERALVADAGHELRTPIAILKAEIELALAGDRDPAELRAALRSAGEEADRLARLADDLLVLARAEEGRLPIHPEPVDAGRVARDVAARFAARAGAEGRPLRVDADAPGPSLRADRLRLEQALANLIDNALRHGAGPVVIGVRGHDATVELWVGDGGAGVPSDEAEQVFGRFARGAGADGRGAGLGLAIVRAIARAHGGEASIAGAVATVRLPARPAAPP